MTSLFCDFGLRGKRNKRFKGEREREGEREGFAKQSLGERGDFFVETSFFKSHGQMLKCLIASHLETLNLEIWNYQPP